MWFRKPRGSNPCKWCQAHEGQSDDSKDIMWARHDSCQCMIGCLSKGEFLGRIKGGKYLYKKDSDLFSYNVDNEIQKIASLSVELPKPIQYYNKQVKLEQVYTKLMKEIEQESDLNLIGLDYRLKSKESFLRKYSNNILFNDIKEIKDVNRYTLVGDLSNLGSETISILHSLEQRGYNISEVKNTWYNGSSYKGINTVIRDKNGTPFELQFHTQESFELKNGKLHKLYEQQRMFKKYSKSWWVYENKMIELSCSIKNPKDIEKVK
ncbi:hypothetical protein LJB88_02060 [Erysipelotrichaceae bacterium OttesenSCG-928-M19]|nr:hypothetical protein [Erysipelotrichaceae bacterium OttesenSCG-928-M19]